MTATNPGMFGRLKLYLSMVRFGIAHNRDFALGHHGFYQEMIGRLKDQGCDPQGLRVLDVGCGKTFWLSLLLHSYGAKVTGIDTEPASPRITPASVVRIARTQGWERAARTAVWGLVFAREYYRALARLTSFPLEFSRLDLRTIDTEYLPFDDGVFDLVVSHEVLEHIPDVPRALDEIVRVMKPTGLTYIYVHNYTSISGGHHIAWKYPETEPSKVVPPWDHLRENRFPDIPSWINRLRMVEYRRSFEERFAILDWVAIGPEGASLLTREIEEELAGYSREELLTKGFIVISRPK